MTISRLLAHLDRVAAAPGGVHLLRDCLVDLAVQGRLAPDPVGSPAEPLSDGDILNGIAALAARSKKTRWRPFPPVSPGEEPFDLPDGWIWARINDTGLYVNGIPFKPSDWGEDGIPIVRIQNLSNPDALPNFAKGEFPDENLVRDGDILVSWSATLDAYVWDRGLAVVNQHIFKVIPNEYAVDPGYLYWLLKHAIRVLAASSHAHGLAMKHINRGPFLEHVVALPPISVQQQAAAKIDELMLLCDEIETSRRIRDERLDRVMQVAAGSLVNGGDSKEAEAFFVGSLERLTLRAPQVANLRESFFRLAVRGRLVPQSPTDGGVIDALRKAGIEPVADAPFAVPTSWAWVHVGAIGDARLGKMLDKAKNRGTPRRYLRNINVRWFDFDLTSVLEMRFEDSELEEFALRSGDVLICEGGEPGRAAVWDERESNIYFQKAIHRLRLPEGIVLPQYFVYALREAATTGRLADHFTGLTFKHLTGKGLASFTFPIPPYEEQEKIVVRLDELLMLCDQVESSLASHDHHSDRFAEAVIRDALNTVS